MRYRIRSALIAITAGMLLGSGSAQALKAPTITAPTSGSTVSTTPTLQWSAVTGASWYRVWLSRSSGGPNILPCAFNQGAVDPGGCWLQGSVSLAVTAPLALGAHTLWVMAWSPSGSVWSAATPFTVAAAVSRFEDRGETVFDKQTNLEWEKKTDDGGIHDKVNYYKWSTGTNNPDGTAFTVFLAGLNAGACSSTSDGTTESNQTDCSFAGHGDWRLPKLSELKTIVDCSHGAPCVDSIFGPTQLGFCWSSSSYASYPFYAWTVYFSAGNGYASYKPNSLYVRAVRGGSD